MRKFVIVLCLAVAVPSAALAINLASFERMLVTLSQSIRGLKGLAAEARASSGLAKEEALVRGRDELSRLAPLFRDAKIEAEHVEQEASIEKLIKGADRTNDFIEAYKKFQELDALLRDTDELKDEFCGPRDLYRFSGDCPPGTNDKPAIYGVPRN